MLVYFDRNPSMSVCAYNRQKYMEETLVLVFFVLLVANLAHGLRTAPQLTKRELKQLDFINKPAIKSFKTKHGDTLDCVEIHKQLAFDHPLLKNHTIQMKPTVQFPSTAKSPSRYSQLLPKHIECPTGTVLVKRVQKEDLLMSKLSSSFGNNLLSSVITVQGGLPEGHHVATVVMPAKNSGVQGQMNIWQPEAQADQFSAGMTFVASPYGELANGVGLGWSVNPNVYQSPTTRLTGYWTTDSGVSTGCFNQLCPGFVQISQHIFLGAATDHVSTYDGAQYEFQANIVQDPLSGNWWLNFGDQPIGYYPKELFTSLVVGATAAGWGGEVASPSTMPSPAMGSGHFPEESFNKACYVKNLMLLDGARPFPPDKSAIQENISNPKCYKAAYIDDGGEGNGHVMFFGGPPNCVD